MRHSILCLAVVVGFSASAFAEDTPEAVINKAVEANGGVKTLSKYMAARFNMTGSMSVMGVELEFTGKIASQYPDRFLLEMNSEIMGQKLVVHQVVKGEKMKSKVTVGGTVVSTGTPEEKEEMKMNLAMQNAESLLPLLDKKKFKLTSGGEEDVDGKKAFVINVTAIALKRDFKVFLDKKSNLMVKTSHRGQGFGDGGAAAEVLIESYHTEFKKINDVQVATKLIVKHDDKKFMTLNVSDYEMLEKIDDKEFTVED